MAEKSLQARIQNKIDLTANWEKATNFIPKKGEIIVYSDGGGTGVPKMKVGDGTTKVGSLKFADEGQYLPLAGGKLTGPLSRGAITMNSQSGGGSDYGYDSLIFYKTSTGATTSNAKVAFQYRIPTGTSDGTMRVVAPEFEGKLIGNADTATTATTASKVANALSINGKSYNGSTAVDVGVIGAEYGGSGKTTLEKSAFAFLEALPEGAYTPSDNAQVVLRNPNTSASTAFPLTRLWNYIKDKGDSTYQPKGTYLTSLPVASTSTLGGVKIGSGLTVAEDGTISAAAAYTLPTASSSVKGGIIVGTGLSITTEGKLSVSKVPNALSINGKSYDGSAVVDVGVIGAEYGGTGERTLRASANALINALDTGSESTPVDADYFISQYIGGGTTTTTYFRRPISVLYTYMKDKMDNVYQAKGTYLTSLPTASSSVKGGIKVGTGLTMSSETLNHSNSVTAKTAYGSTSTTASANGGSITVTDIKYDAQGHITGSTDRTITLSQTTYTLAGLMGSAAKGSATQPVYWNGSAWTNTTYTLGKSVPEDAKFTDTVYTLPTASSTLGGVKTTSTVSATTGLTACPIIDGVVYYKDTNNTYTLAELVGSTAIGTATNPIYWDGTKFVKTTYTLGKSVPADAKFTDTVYTLPTASSSTLGGIKLGTGLTAAEDGTVNVSVGGATITLKTWTDADVA